MTADLDAPTATEVPTCASCKWSRDGFGEVFNNGERAFCVQPAVTSDDGHPVACERQRFAPSSSLLHQCGRDGILWESR
jgi:hypothetical protein